MSGGQALEEGVEAGGGHLGGGAEGEEARGEGRHLLPGEAQELPRPPYPAEDLQDLRGGGRHVVGEVVHGVRQAHDPLLAELQDVAELGQGVPRLARGDAEGHPHPGRVLGKADQLLHGDARLARGGGDLRELPGGHGDDPGEAQKLPLEGHEGGGGGVHHLAHVGEGVLKVHRRPGGEDQGRGEGRPGPGHGKPRPQALEGEVRPVGELLHPAQALPHPAQGVGDAVRQVQQQLQPEQGVHSFLTAT